MGRVRSSSAAVGSDRLSVSELQVRRKLAVEAEGNVVWDFGAGELLERVGVEHEQGTSCLCAAL